MLNFKNGAYLYRGILCKGNWNPKRKLGGNHAFFLEIIISNQNSKKSQNTKQCAEFFPKLNINDL